MTRTGRFFFILIVVFLLLSITRSGVMDAVMSRLVSVTPEAAVEIPSAETAYYLAEQIPSREALPKSMSEKLGTCYHLNYEDITGPGWGREEWKLLLGAAAQNSRCVLVYTGPGEASNVGRLRELFGVMAEMGFSKIVLRVHVKIKPEAFWGLESQVGDLSDAHRALEIARSTYGGWVDAWALNSLLQENWLLLLLQGGGRNVARDLAAMGVYVQLFNEPNVAEEWENPPADLFDHRGLYRGGYRDLGRRICLLHMPYVRALFDPMVIPGNGTIRYDTSVVQPILVIPDIAAATGDQKRAYLEGCLSAFAEVPPMSADPVGVSRSEYMIYAMRGARLAYGLHLYAPNCDQPPEAIAEAMQREHVDVIREVLGRYSFDGLPFISEALITEFGGSFAPGSGCDREKQKRLYTVFTALYPDVPAFWWVFLGRSCRDGAYAGNTPEEWDKSALMAWRMEGGKIRFENCVRSND